MMLYDVMREVYQDEGRRKQMLPRPGEGSVMEETFSSMGFLGLWDGWC